MKFQEPQPRLLSESSKKRDRLDSILLLKETFLAMFRDSLRENRNTGLCLMLVLIYYLFNQDFNSCLHGLFQV